MTKKQKNRIHIYFKVSLILLISTGVIAAALFFININSYLANDGEKVVYSNALYTLKGNPTDLQKDLFKELTTEVEKSSKENEFKIVELVVKNFIADFYTWTNKIGAYDIGGKDFIFATEFTNFNSTSRRYSYNEMSNYISKDIGQKDLNEVETITVLSVNYAGQYDYYGTFYPAYYVEAEWTYKTNEIIDTSVFPTWGAFTIVQTIEGRYEIVRFY